MNINVNNHLSMLGLKVRDRVSGYTGTITSVGFDLYGCIQAVVHPGIDKEGKLGDPCWFDIARLEVTDKKPVMALPNFEFGPVSEGQKGPSEKPSFMKR